MRRVHDSSSPLRATCKFVCLLMTVPLTTLAHATSLPCLRRRGAREGAARDKVRLHCACAAPGGRRNPKLAWPACARGRAAVDVGVHPSLGGGAAQREAARVFFVVDALTSSAFSGRRVSAAAGAAGAALAARTVGNRATAVSAGTALRPRAARAHWWRSAWRKDAATSPEDLGNRRGGWPSGRAARRGGRPRPEGQVLRHVKCFLPLALLDGAPQRVAASPLKLSSR